ncbi:hypothetical protein Ccrd_025928, partial [Cynara cardunculus var. scolymus]
WYHSLKWRNHKLLFRISQEQEPELQRLVKACQKTKRHVTFFTTLARGRKLILDIATVIIFNFIMPNGFIVRVDIPFSTATIHHILRRWKLLDFVVLKWSSVSFLEVEKPETVVSRWSRATMHQENESAI